MYTRYLYEDVGLFRKLHGLENEQLGLPDEDLYDYTMEATKLVENGYWAMYVH